MEQPALPYITSFIIRFVVSSAPMEADQSRQINTYYGAIRHIQSDEELNFSNWEEAVQFIARFVALENHSKLVD